MLIESAFPVDANPMVTLHIPRHGTFFHGRRRIQPLIKCVVILMWTHPAKHWTHGDITPTGRRIFSRGVADAFRYPQSAL